MITKYVKKRLLPLCVALTLGLSAGMALAQQPEAPQQKMALPDVQQAAGMLLAADHAGNRLVAVGEYGAVLLSDDGGQHFRQAGTVPTRVTLTSVSFADERNGWAAGHWGTIIHTTDGGQTWSLQRSDVTTDQPLFSIHFSDASHGVAVGLWSLLLTTEDGGRSWQQVKLPKPPDGGRADRNLMGLFNSGKRLYAVAERGLVLRSDDLGQNWTYLDTGYKGSFWTGLALRDGSLLVAGLRGTIYRSSDGGDHWQAIDSGVKSSITALTQIGQRVIAVGLDGVVLWSDDQGRSFHSAQREDRLTLTAVSASGPATAIAFSKQGVVPDFMRLLPKTSD
ncbi:WD40/YVTN/BNR-like repeat-containing protein [Herbaspirillum rubrisubalbicans]|uniref:Glycosyl hydrolase n=1 Tax=Herbaspirillum rubrisubalbicans TaxID=80842 RepID=A0AAD0UD85_9BURK|nr:YCF48-related protein [Herbaspirillum rubrisubalbicans]AYR24759.1 glycosyl hydrolase [Herbaspirillum rubrisubalbicans]